MDKRVFKVLDYVDDNGEGQTLNFECTTPHILISGDAIEDILALEKKMLKNLSDSNGREVNLVVIDDKKVLPDDFFKDLEFNYISRSTEEDAILFLDGYPSYKFMDRYSMLIRFNLRNFTDLNESGKEHLKMLVYFFPSMSDNQKLHKALSRSATAIQAGVHIIAGIDFILEKPQLLNGCETRLSFPSKYKFKDMKFFTKFEKELPKTGNLWLKNKNGDVKPIELK